MAPETIKSRQETGQRHPNKKSANNNHATMPSRNYAIIAESHDFSTSDTSSGQKRNGVPMQIDGMNGLNGEHSYPGLIGKHPNTRLAIHGGEENAGTEHAAANGLTKTGLAGDYGLDITLRVEISNQDKEGHTEGYGFSIPALDAHAYEGQGTNW